MYHITHSKVVIQISIRCTSKSAEHHHLHHPPVQRGRKRLEPGPESVGEFLHIVNKSIRIIPACIVSRERERIRGGEGRLMLSIFPASLMLHVDGFKRCKGELLVEGFGMKEEDLQGSEMTAEIMHLVELPVELVLAQPASGSTQGFVGEVGESKWFGSGVGPQVSAGSFKVL